MKKIVAPVCLLLALLQTAFAQTPELSSWVRNTNNETGYNNIPSNVQIVQYSDNNVYVSCTCIPGYDIGPWNMNPNVPANQNFVFKITRHPQKNTGTLTAVGLGHTGVWSNGVTVFNSDDAQTYNNQGVWHRNAYYWEGNSFDNCLGHPQQQGEYHHHVSPTCLYDETDSTHHSPIIGYAFDGFPIYGAYAYSNTDGTGAIKRMTPSYRKRDITTRTTLPDGSNASAPGPAVNTQYPLGCYIQDYEYIANLGDLDEHNGRFCITPEYPSGTYAYFVTLDANLTPVFPYTYIGTYYGVVPPGNVGPGSGHVTISEATTVYNGTTGTKDVDNTIQFDLSPNPVRDYAFVYFDPGSANNIQGTIYNENGQLLETINNLQPSISYTLDFTRYPPGIYFVHFKTDKQNVVQKVVKIK